MTFVFLCFRLRVGELQTFISTSGHVRHMEVDLLHSERLLFSDTHAFKVTDGATTSTIVGSGSAGYYESVGTSAKFSVITGFTQINSTSVLVVDNNNHCLRIFDRGVLRTSRFVGSCRSNGFRNGASALFTYPWSVIRDIRSTNKVLVSDCNNYAVRQVDLITRITITLISQSNGLSLSYVYGLTFDTDGETLLITNNQLISQYNFTTQTLTTVAGSSSAGFRDGALSSAQFNQPLELIRLSSSVTLVAGYNYHRLRVVNSDTGLVQSICTGSAGYTDGSAQNCLLKYPSSLLANGSTIYVGQYGRIRTMACE